MIGMQETNRKTCHWHLYKYEEPVATHGRGGNDAFGGPGPASLCGELLLKEAPDGWLRWLRWRKKGDESCEGHNSKCRVVFNNRNRIAL